MASFCAQMVHLDPLTKLYNRRFLTEHLDEKITRGDNEFAVALLDIDDFKKINDTYGHVYGDETLTSFAKIMMKHMEGQGIAARFGGEEFSEKTVKQEDSILNFGRQRMLFLFIL